MASSSSSSSSAPLLSSSSDPWDSVLALKGASSLSAAAPAAGASTSPHAKWLVLALYSYLSALQSLLWMTYSSVPDESMSWLSASPETLDLWLDWGPVAFCLSVLPSLWLLSSRRTGLQLSIRLGFALCSLAAALRCLPLLLPASARAALGPGHTACLAITHVAQFINGAVAPLAVSSPSYLSLLWFPEGMRNFATALANVANAGGRAVGFLLGPALVHAAGDVPTLLLLELGLSVLPALVALAFCPSFPAQPPSEAAAAEAAGWAQQQQAEEEEEEGPALQGGSGSGAGRAGRAAGGGHSLQALLQEARRLLRHPPFLLLSASGGIVMAFYGAWSGVLPSALQGAGLTAVQAGNMGAINTFAGILGGLLAGALTDLPALRTSLKAVIAALSLSSGALFLLLALALPPLAPASGGLSGLSYGALLALCALAGALRGGVDPLFFELAAEAAHAVGGSAGSAGAVLTLLYHAALCCVLSVPADPLKAAVLPGMPAALLVSVLLMLPAQVAYGRRSGSSKAAGGLALQ